MREVANADYRTLDFDPMRLAQPPTEAEKKYPARVRVGPDWLAFIGNWMTEWERTGATAMEQRMLARAIKRARYMALLPYVATAG